MLEVLDRRQLTRIEAVHRGFLYQHLYVVGCLLLAGPNEVDRITVEGDEDVELDRPQERVYIQVKTRSAPLQPNDIQGALERFGVLRAAHSEQQRSGQPSFVIVCNTPPSRDLKQQYKDDSWPTDIHIVCPDVDESHDPFLPPPWQDVLSAVHWCIERARALPMRMVEPETLVWKLSGRAQFAAMGGISDHAFLTTELPSLFEQIAIQLQQFPSAPVPYRPQENEPELDSGERVRLISGFSGAGKTAWASHSAMFMPGLCAYYDVGDVPGPAIAASLVRELGAQWANKEEGDLRQILMPGTTGIEALRALDRYLASLGEPALVVLDNAHRVPADDLRILIESTHHLRVVLLAQPKSSLVEIASALTIAEEELAGWGLDQLAEEVQAQGATASTAHLARLKRLTGGLPLYVKSATQLASTLYGGDVAAMCDAVLQQENIRHTAQELVLARLFASLPSAVQEVVAVLSLADVPLDHGEAKILAQTALNFDGATITRSLRNLGTLGAVRFFGNGRLQVHDALRLLGSQHFMDFTEEKRVATHRSLREILEQSFIQRREMSRFPLYIRTLLQLEDVETLIDIGSEEWFHELGISVDIWEELERAAINESLDPRARFYALDGVVFARMKAGMIDQVRLQLDSMQALVDQYDLSSNEQITVRLKRMVYDASKGDETAVDAAIEELQSNLPAQESHLRIALYSAALALHTLKRYEPAEIILQELVKQYYDVLGIGPADIIGASNADIAEMMRQRKSAVDDAKHLADCLDFLAKALNAMGRDSGLARVHAMKWYAMAHALDSLVNVGQDLADEFIGRGDAIGAREVLEQHILPIVRDHNLLDKLVGVRSQYAVVLAYCGDHVGAARELSRLEPYLPGLTDWQQQELKGQKRLVARIRRSASSKRFPQEGRSKISRQKKVGRNEPCPCGSGMKFKRCHGG